MSTIGDKTYKGENFMIKAASPDSPIYKRGFCIAKVVKLARKKREK